MKELESTVQEQMNEISRLHDELRTSKPSAFSDSEFVCVSVISSDGDVVVEITHGSQKQQQFFEDSIMCGVPARLA